MIRWPRAVVGSSVRPARQRGRDPQHLAGGVGDVLDVHPVAAVLGRVVAAAVAGPVALSEGPVQQYEVRVAPPQGLQQSWSTADEQTDDARDVCVSGTGGYPEAGRDAREGVVTAQVHQGDQRTPVRRKLAPPVTLHRD